MLLGKPVVATNYSGNVDFMNAKNSFPVKYKLVSVGADDYPGAEGQVWAEAAIGHAAAQMQRIYRDPAAAALIGENARRFVQAHYSADTVGANYHDWLSKLDPRPWLLHLGISEGRIARK